MSPADPTAARVVDDLVRSHLLDAQLRTRALAVVATTLAGDAGRASDGGRAASRPLPKLVEVVAYLGGALVLAATGLFLGLQWNDLGFTSQVGLLIVATAALAAGGFVARPGASEHDVRRRLSGALSTGAAASAWALVALVADRFLDRDPVDWPTLLGAFAMLVVTAWGYRIAHTALGVLAAAATATTIALVLVDNVGQGLFYDGAVVATALLVLAAGWLALAEGGLFREQTVARAAGVVIAFVGAQAPVFDSDHSGLGYLLTAAVVVGAVTLYLRRHAWPYLAVAVIGVTVVVPEAMSDWTDGSLGVIGGVLVTGVTLLLAALGGQQLRRS